MGNIGSDICQDSVEDEELGGSWGLWVHTDWVSVYTSRASHNTYTQPYPLAILPALTPPCLSLVLNITVVVPLTRLDRRQQVLLPSTTGADLLRYLGKCQVKDSYGLETIKAIALPL